LRHVRGAEDVLGVERIVDGAREPEVVDRRGASVRDGYHAIELELPPARAAPAVRGRPGASTGVALPDLAADCGGNVLVNR
jgi:hypothetical protein